MSSYDDILASCNRYEEVAQRSSFIHGHYLVAFHNGFACLNGIDLGNDDFSAKAFCSHSNASAAHAVACNDNCLTSYYEVCSGHYRRPYGLARTESVIEKMLTSCIVNCHNGIKKLILALKDLKSVNACRCLFASALKTCCKILHLGVKEQSKVAAVIDYDVRLESQSAS